MEWSILREALPGESGRPTLTRPCLGSRVEARYRTVSEPRLLEVLLLGGWAFEVEAGRHAEALASTLTALDSWIELGLQYRRSERGERLYDPVEVLNFQKWAGLNGRDRFWIDRCVRTNRALVRDWAETKRDGVSWPDGRSDAPFHVTLQRTFDVRNFERGAKLRLRMPMPLPGAYVREIESVPVVSSDLRAEIFLSDGRMEARLAAFGEPFIEIGAEVSFIATPRPAGTVEQAGRLDPAKAEIYLRPIDGPIRITPKIRTLANFLAGPERGPWETVRTFWTYMIDELIPGMVHYDQVYPEAPGDWVLESGWYDCQLGSALFVSMCRARGIPARIINGHFLYRLAPTNHFWAEVWIDGQGWLPFDFLSWDLSAGGHDPEWRDHFAGTIDYRMVTQCLPQAFTGSMSVRLPPAWHMLHTRIGKGIEISMVGLDGSLAYRDRVTVHAR